MTYWWYVLSSIWMFACGFGTAVILAHAEILRTQW